MGVVKIAIRERYTDKELFTHECDDNTMEKTLNEAARQRISLEGADLRFVDLSGAFLHDLNLRGASLVGAKMVRCSLRYVSMAGADLKDADLRVSTFYNVDLSYADMRGGNFQNAIISFSTLSRARLNDCNFFGVYFLNPDMRGAKTSGAAGLYYACPTEGEFIGWKKASGFIVKLRIPADALRSSATSTKCRCNKAFVLDIQNVDGSAASVQSVASNRDSKFKYARNSWVEVDDFATDRWDECAPGIHFFVDRQEAVDYD